jgi:beta-lactamase regulating signal transducer with metallopeptidase domain
MLTVAQKVAREKVAKTILEILTSHATSNFHFAFTLTGNESWLL